LFFYSPFLPNISLRSTHIELKFKGNEKIIAEEEETEEGQGVGFCEQMAIAASSIADFIYKNSYIFTNVIMMVRILIL
jgi:hypothetical protein